MITGGRSGAAGSPAANNIGSSTRVQNKSRGGSYSEIGKLVPISPPASVLLQNFRGNPTASLQLSGMTILY